MATANVKTVTKRNVTLELDHDEAQALRDILANVGGLSYGMGTSEKAAARVRNALNTAGFASRFAVVGSLRFTDGV